MSLSYEQLVDRLLDALGEARQDRPPPTARLYEDLDFDSFRVVEVLAFIEQGHDPPDDPPRLSSLGDVFAYHQSLAAASAACSESDRVFR